MYEYVFGVPLPPSPSQDAVALERLRHVDNIEELFPELLARARRRATRRQVRVVVPAEIGRVQRAYARQEAREAKQAAATRQRRRNHMIRRVIGSKPRQRRFVMRLVWRATFAVLGGR